MNELEKVVQHITQLKEDMDKLNLQLQTIKTTGEAGAGLIKATINGRKQILQIDIDESLLTSKEKENLQDLLVAAINLAMKKIEEKTRANLEVSSMLPNMFQETKK